MARESLQALFCAFLMDSENTSDNLKSFSAHPGYSAASLGSTVLFTGTLHSIISHATDSLRFT